MFCNFYCLPRLVEGSKDISLDDLVTDVAEVTEELVVVGLAVGQPLALVVPVAQEWFLTLGANKMFHMPMFA